MLLAMTLALAGCSLGPGGPPHPGAANPYSSGGFHDAGPNPDTGFDTMVPQGARPGNHRHARACPGFLLSPISSGPGIAARRQIVDTNARPCPAAAQPAHALAPFRLAGKLLTIIRDKPANSAFRSPIRARLSTP